MGRSNARLTGTVKNIVNDRGFGFIKLDDSDTEYFFHYTGCVGVKFDVLKQGTRVSFIAGTGTKGPRAEQVELA